MMCIHQSWSKGWSHNDWSMGPPYHQDYYEYTLSKCSHMSQMVPSARWQHLPSTDTTSGLSSSKEHAKLMHVAVSETHLANGFSENLFKLLSTKWVVLIESDEFVEGVEAGLLNQVVAHPAIIHLVVNAAVTDSVNTSADQG